MMIKLLNSIDIMSILTLNKRYYNEKYIKQSINVITVVIVNIIHIEKCINALN